MDLHLISEYHNMNANHLYLKWNVNKLNLFDSVQDSYEEQEFWID